MAAESDPANLEGHRERNVLKLVMILALWKQIILQVCQGKHWAENRNVQPKSFNRFYNLPIFKPLFVHPMRVSVELATSFADYVFSFWQCSQHALLSKYSHCIVHAQCLDIFVYSGVHNPYTWYSRCNVHFIMPHILSILLGTRALAS